MNPELVGIRWPLVRAVVAKDLAVLRRSRMLLSTITLVPLLLVVVLPAVGLLLPTLLGPQELAKQFSEMPRAVKAMFAGHPPAEIWVLYASQYMFAPFFLMVPLMASTGVAADSVAGERERKTLEALLFTPLTDLELFLAKLLGAWATAMAVTLAAFVAYTVTVTAAAWPIMGRLFFPTPAWLLLILLVVPGASALGLGVVVLISARVSTAYEAFQTGGMVVVPVVLLIFGQVSGVVLLGPMIVVLLGVVVWAVALVLLRLGFSRFTRPQLLNRV